jgi:hypothetical protein
MIFLNLNAKGPSHTFENLLCLQSLTSPQRDLMMDGDEATGMIFEDCSTSYLILLLFLAE